MSNEQALSVNTSALEVCIHVRHIGNNGNVSLLSRTFTVDELEAQMNAQDKVLVSVNVGDYGVARPRIGISLP